MAFLEVMPAMTGKDMTQKEQESRMILLASRQAAMKMRRDKQHMARFRKGDRWTNMAFTASQWKRKDEGKMTYPEFVKIREAQGIHMKA